MGATGETKAIALKIPYRRILSEIAIQRKRLSNRILVSAAVLC